jgi:erythromycin esterase
MRGISMSNHIKALKSRGQPLSDPSDLDGLLAQIGDSQYVLLGEATHGTHEYYTWRAAITKRLIEEKGFSIIAVEGDWPDCYRINRYIKRFPGAHTPISDLFSTFRRWPTWMWANWETAALVEWLKEYNHLKEPNKKIGFYGLDVYSLWESMDILINYLRKEDPSTAEIAAEVVNCFQAYEENGELYARDLRFMDGCRDEVVQLLKRVRRKAPNYNHDPEGGLNAEINSMVIANGENYYRAMTTLNQESWNVRDEHMVETLDKLVDFHGANTKVVVWEHNTHIGDARYTNMKNDQLINVGQLVRQKHQNAGTVLVGFGSYEGKVIAARNWGGNITVMNMPKAQTDSIEHELHMESTKDRILLFNDSEVKKQYDRWVKHRAIGVVYRPEFEYGNYVPTKLSSRYDAFIYLDKTTALHPMHIKPDGQLMPDTYPFGI